MTKLNEKFQNIIDEFSEYFLERREETKGLILALLSRSNIFLVGPPGTAKSLLIRTLSDITKEADCFDYLMTKQTKEAELFGSTKMSELKNDKFVRKIEGKLPDAHYANLEEIWKSNSAILNSLLTIINEKIYHNGDEIVDVPLQTVMASSNSTPENRTKLAALYDRFPLKYHVGYIEDNRNFMDMLKLEDSPNPDINVTLDEIKEAQNKVDNVSVPNDIIKTINDIRNKLKKESIQPSDRRYRTALQVIKANTWLHGRSTATSSDLRVLRHILWTKQDDINEVADKVLSNATPILYNAEQYYDEAMDIYKQYKRYQNATEEEKEKIDIATVDAVEVSDKLQKFHKKIESEKETAIENGVPKDTIEKINEYIKDIKTRKLKMRQDELGLDKDTLMEMLMDEGDFSEGEEISIDDLKQSV